REQLAHLACAHYSWGATAELEGETPFTGLPSLQRVSRLCVGLPVPSTAIPFPSFLSVGDISSVWRHFMNRCMSRRLSVEFLEDRWCPSVSARLSAGGNLLIKGSSTDLQITQVAPHSFDVFDDGVKRGSFSGVNSLQVNLRGDNDRVTIDLGGF